IRSCEELWQKGLYVELHAYQHHVFMDWRFVDDPRWGEVHSALNGAGVASMQGRFDEMFGVKKEVIAEEPKVKKPRKKAAAKKSPPKGKEERGKKPAVKKSVKETKKAPAKNKPAVKTTKSKAGVKKTVKKSS